ncbi:MAG: 1-(5-phosphoribosyl)-5-[(5-phosphoribosylamino)methylideneamino]imidazole-4-carboxamide isomerase [Blastocatellia bacterium]|nr:1-(5-phosphoribosyl)-5-[(5-phosphoribosylamino)methylideneamino]imidazole-4-carboxamide isomerase [Blastocatellia bacterium]
MIVIPAIDLKNGACVRLTQGEKEQVKIYDQDPVKQAIEFEAAGAKMLHVVDLDGAFTGGSAGNLGVVQEIVMAVSIPIEFGGGVRDVVAVEKLVELGVEQVIIGTVAVENLDLLARLAVDYSKKIVVGIDAREGKVATRGWVKESEVDAIELAHRVRELGIERVIYTDIAQDGMLNGPNIEMTKKIAFESRLKITASGGVGSLEDVRRLKEIEHYGVDSCIIGKALYEKRFTLQEALEIAV